MDLYSMSDTDFDNDYGTFKNTDTAQALRDYAYNEPLDASIQAVNGLLTVDAARQAGGILASTLPYMAYNGAKIVQNNINNLQSIGRYVSNETPAWAKPPTIPLKEVVNTIIPNSNGVRRPLKYWNRDVVRKDLTPETVGAKPLGYLEQNLNNFKYSNYRYADLKAALERELMDEESSPTGEALYDVLYRKMLADTTVRNPASNKEYDFPLWDMSKKTPFDVNGTTDIGQHTVLSGRFSKSLGTASDPSARIVSMTPEQFMRLATRSINRYYKLEIPSTYDMHIDDMVNGNLESRKATRYANELLKGNSKFPMPTLMVHKNFLFPDGITHDGRHRVVGAALAGINEIPVLLYGDPSAFSKFNMP